MKAEGRKFPKFTHEEEGTWSGPFLFVQGADTQFGLIDVMKKKSNIQWDEEMVLTKKAVAAINKMRPKPKFFVVCGDLVDAFPEIAAEMRTEQEKDFKKVFEELDPDIPLVCVCGNHDVGNTPTHATIDRFRKTFGDDFFSFWVQGVFFIVLNSQYYDDSSEVPDLAEEHKKWLEEQLQSIKFFCPEHVVIFQHIPWFLKDPDEPNVYYDEANNYKFNIDGKIRKEMLQILREAGVKAVFCGHYHRNAGGWYRDMEMVVTSAIGYQAGEDTHGIRVVSVQEKEIQHKYYALDEVPNEIDLQKPLP